MYEIEKNQDVKIRYAKLDKNTFIECDYENSELLNSLPISLVIYTKDGIRIIGSRIGEVKESNEKYIIAEFNQNFEYTNELYAIVTNANNINTVVVAYST